jgi:hypothetical protein
LRIWGRGGIGMSSSTTGEVSSSSMVGKVGCGIPNQILVDDTPFSLLHLAPPSAKLQHNHREAVRIQCDDTPFGLLHSEALWRIPGGGGPFNPGTSPPSTQLVSSSHPRQQGPPPPGATSAGWSGSHRAAARTNRERRQDGRMGGEPSSSDAVGTSVAAKTSRPLRLAEEEAPGVTVSVVA